MADGSAPVIGMAEDVETFVSFKDNLALAAFCGPCDRNLEELEKHHEITILRRGNGLVAISPPERAAEIKLMLEALAISAHENVPIDIAAAATAATVNAAMPALSTRKNPILPRTKIQASYISALLAHELSFGVGPAGTGKTYLAVATAASMFINGDVDRIILARPAVEAGERLGFLPGDMKDKIDPYMQPLYDALGDVFPAKMLAKLLEEKRIEIAPLAFMRGRTLSNAFVVLDEAQNATAVQMKMFLTRLGQGSRMVITGDPNQTDLPRGTISGLVEAMRVLEAVDGISVTRFTTADVVRHPMVARILEAYDRS